MSPRSRVAQVKLLFEKLRDAGLYDSGDRTKQAKYLMSRDPLAPWPGVDESLWSRGLEDPTGRASQVWDIEGRMAARKAAAKAAMENQVKPYDPGAGIDLVEKDDPDWWKKLGRLIGAGKYYFRPPSEER